MSLKEINEYNQYSPIYDGEIISRTFARYKGRRDSHCPCALPVVRLTTEEFPETVSLPCTVAPDNTIRSNTVVTNYNFIWVTCKSVWIA